jgi:hypothetical protein
MLGTSLSSAGDDCRRIFAQALDRRDLKARAFAALLRKLPCKPLDAAVAIKARRRQTTATSRERHREPEQ